MVRHKQQMDHLIHSAAIAAAAVAETKRIVIDCALVVKIEMLVLPWRVEKGGAEDERFDDDRVHLQAEH